MEVERLRQGLWRWTAPHPEWDPGGTGASAWPQMVGSVYYEAPEATVLIDPLVPCDPSDAARFWAALDRDVERRGLPVATLRTVHWHERSCAQIRARYPTYEGHPPSVAAIALGDPIGETHFHLAEHRALVPGDVLLGASGGGLRLCPPSWYAGSDDERAWHRERMRTALEPLLDLDIASVLCSHWQPVLIEGHAALRAAVHASG
jgi:hypothetical protein